MEIFEKASRLGIYFETSVGNLLTEDLWHLPLKAAKPSMVSLDDIARSLDRQIRESTTQSFVDDSPQIDEKLTLKFDIVRHIIGVVKAENMEKREAKSRAEQKQVLLGLLAQKELEEMSAGSKEEILARIAAL